MTGRPIRSLAGLAVLVAAVGSAAGVAHGTARGTNGKIAFHRDQVWLMNKDGTGQTQVTPADGDSAFTHTDPACSPDGTQIAYIAIVGTSNGAVAVIDANGENFHYVSGQQHAASAPAWSPDGTRLAWSQHNGQRREIVVSDADVVNQYTELTGVRDPNTGNFADGDNIQPEWSPDGKKIAFASDRDGDYDIYTINVTTHVIKQLTNSPGPDTDPSWAPGGGRIAFARFSNGNTDVWVMRSDGSNPVDVTASSAATDWEPSWSPDGVKIAFTRGYGANAKVFKMNTDGSGATLLADSAGTPSWCGVAP